MALKRSSGGRAAAGAAAGAAAAAGVAAEGAGMTAFGAGGGACGALMEGEGERDRTQKIFAYSAITLL